MTIPLPRPCRRRAPPVHRTTGSPSIDEMAMTPTFRGACRTLLPLTVVISAAAAHAQTTTPAKPDSTAAARADSTAHVQQAPKKHGFFSRVVSAASHASTVVQEKTGINPEDALQGAALIAARANPAMAMMQAMQAAQQLQSTQAAQMAGAATGGRGASIAGLGAGMATGAAQMQVMQRLQKMMGGSGAGAAAAAAGTSQSAELGAMQLQMAQIATLASRGDQNAMTQLMRFQGEMAASMVRLNALGPAQQQSALPAAMRAAIACATTGQGCTAATK